MNELQKKIAEKTAKIAVIGLGYVGLPMAASFAEVGFNVIGLEIRPNHVETINHGICPIEGDEPGLADLIRKVIESARLRATLEYESIKDCDVILIAVETPVDSQNMPHYEALYGALQSLGPVMKSGALVIIESTTAPGTMTDLVVPVLEKSSKKRVNAGFYLGNCPERVMPGKLLKNLKTMNRVIGADTQETTEMMVGLYRHIVHAELDIADWVTTELVKTTENAYRDVQIAFANEVALICEAVGGNVWKVRELVNKSPMRQMHLPGAGVGGHCIPKDPWLLVHGMKEKNVPIQLIPASRAVNDSMPSHMVELIQDGLGYLGCEIAHARILVLGYAYLEDSDDTRNSPSMVLINQLQKLGGEVLIHDPHVDGYKGDLLTLAKGADAIVVMVAHKLYKSLELSDLSAVVRSALLIDGRAVFTKIQAEQAGFKYLGLGQGNNKLEVNYNI